MGLPSSLKGNTQPPRLLGEQQNSLFLHFYFLAAAKGHALPLFENEVSSLRKYCKYVKVEKTL